MLSVASMWGIHCLVFCRTVMLPLVTHVESDVCKCGIAGVGGNKGAVATAFTLGNGTSFCFVSSHLAARAERLKERASCCLSVSEKCL